MSVLDDRGYDVFVLHLMIGQSQFALRICVRLCPSSLSFHVFQRFLVFVISIGGFSTRGPSRPSALFGRGSHGPGTDSRSIGYADGIMRHGGLLGGSSQGRQYQ